MKVSIKKDLIYNGERIQFQCPHCQEIIEDGDKFCGECGRKIKWVWDGCDSEVMIFDQKDCQNQTMTEWQFPNSKQFQCRNCLKDPIRAQANEEGKCPRCGKKFKVSYKSYVSEEVMVMTDKDRLRLGLGLEDHFSYPCYTCRNCKMSWFHIKPGGKGPDDCPVCRKKIEWRI